MWTARCWAVPPIGVVSTLLPPKIGSKERVRPAMAKPFAGATACGQGHQQGRPAYKGSAPIEALLAGIGSTLKGGTRLQGRCLRALRPHELLLKGSGTRPPTEGSDACRRGNRP
ncbi:hypothetical protein GW17_00006811 [Ensete ventricosum]|nr:hypothetical protein GW17_00006811 [Ensete ventricosum]